MKKRVYCILLSLCCFMSCFSALSAYADDGVLSIYVSSQNGNDTEGNGSIEKPYRSVQRAQSHISQVISNFTGSEIRVVLREGEYPPIVLYSELSGNEDVTVRYMGYYGETATVTNSTLLSANDFVEVTDSSVRSRIPEKVRDNVRVLDLKKYGINSVPELQPLQNAQETPIGPGLFIDDTYMTTARWPDSGYVKLNEFAKVLSTEYVSDTEEYIHTLSYNPKFYDFSKCKPENKIYLCGFFNQPYFYKYLSLEEIDDKNNTIKLKQQNGSSIRENTMLFVNNVLEELSSPGEWYLSTEDLKLYIYPPYDITNSTIRFVHKEQSTIYTNEGGNTNYTVIENLTIDGSYKCAVVFANNGKHNAVKKCVIKNGCEDAVTINGSYSDISSNHIYNMGIGGVRTTCYSEPGINNAYANNRNVISNNNIHDYAVIQRAYASGIYTYGVGGEISHNEVYNSPHNAISAAGLSTVIEYNSIHDVLTETGDAGAIYIGGRWNTRDHKIRYNKIYNSYSYPEGQNVGIYFDDCASANLAYGNIIDSITGIGIYVHGGCDNVIDNNVISNYHGNNTGEYECAVWVGPVADYSAVMSGMLKQGDFSNKILFASYFEKWSNWGKLFSGEPYNKPLENKVINNTIVGYTNKNSLCYGALNINRSPEDWNLTVKNNSIYENVSDFYNDAQNDDFRYTIPNATESEFRYYMNGADKDYKEWFLDDISENYDAEIKMTVEKFPEYPKELKGEYYGARFTINNRYRPVTFSVEKDGIYYRGEDNIWQKGEYINAITENVSYTYKLKVRGNKCSLYIDNQKQFDFNIPERNEGASKKDDFIVEYKLPQNVKTAFRVNNFKVENVYNNEVIIDCFDREIPRRKTYSLVTRNLDSKLYSAKKLLSIEGENANDDGSIAYEVPNGYYITDFSVVHTHNANNNGLVGVTLFKSSASEYAAPSLIDRTSIYGHKGFRYLISPDDDWKNGNMAKNQYTGMSVKLIRTVDKSQADYPELIRVIIEYKSKNALQDVENVQTVFDKDMIFDNENEMSEFLKSDTDLHNIDPYMISCDDGIRFSNSPCTSEIIKIPVMKMGQKAEKEMNAIENIQYSFSAIDGVSCRIIEEENNYIVKFITDSSKPFMAVGAVYDDTGRLTVVKKELIDFDKWLVIEKNSGHVLKIIAVNNLSELKPLDYNLTKF